MPEIDIVKAEVNNLKEDFKEFKKDTVKNFDILYAITKESNKEIQDLKITMVELNGSIKNMSKSMDNFSEKVETWNKERDKDIKKVEEIRENLDVEMKKVAQEEIEKEQGKNAKSIVVKIGWAIVMILVGYIAAKLGLQ